jgi:hypothetical protein
VLHFRAFARVPRMLGYGHRDPVLIGKSSIVLFCAEPRPAGRSFYLVGENTSSFQ